jgi:hypothetical protein
VPDAGRPFHACLLQLLCEIDRHQGEGSYGNIAGPDALPTVAGQDMLLEVKSAHRRESDRIGMLRCVGRVGQDQLGEPEFGCI